MSSTLLKFIDISDGDTIFAAWGIYATGSVKFSVNLMMEEDFHFMMHVDFRPPPNENKVKFYCNTFSFLHFSCYFADLLAFDLLIIY